MVKKFLPIMEIYFICVKKHLTWVAQFSVLQFTLIFINLYLSAD